MYGASRIPHPARALGANSFTLVELLATIAIVAVVATVAIFFTVGYVSWSRQTAEKQTLAVINDAVNRYKCQGGDINALTLGAPIGNVITRLKTPVNWAGLSHQFLQSSFTHPARSLQAVGTGSQYRFYQCNSFYNETPDANTSTTRNMPYGLGTGFMTNNGSYAYAGDIYTSTHYWAWSSNGTIHGPLVEGANALAAITTGSTNVTFWSCGSSSTTPSGTVSQLYCHDSHLTALDVTALTSMTGLRCYNNSLTALDVSKNTLISYLSCYSNSLTSLDVTKNLGLIWFYCHSNQISTLDLSKNLSLSTCNCSLNNLGPIYLGGHTPTNFVYTPQNGACTPTLN